jgi:nicotinamidase-related amidase
MRQTVLSVLLGVLLVVPPVTAADPATPPAAAKGKAALLVMDTQNLYLGWMDDEGKAVALAMINATIELFRERGLPVIRVYNTDPARGPAPGSEPFEFPATIKVKPDDPVVVKNHPSAFQGTELERILREQGCDTVFVTGLSAVGCALATYFDAQRLDFRAFMVKDALLSHRADLTRSVEEITEAVSYDAMDYMLLGSKAGG